MIRKPGFAALALVGLAALTPTFAQGQGQSLPRQPMPRQPMPGSPAPGAPTAPGTPATPGTRLGGATSPVTPTDQKFIQDSSISYLEVVEFGRLAEARGANAEVKAYGKRLVADLGKVLQQLSAVGAPKGISLPPELPDVYGADRDKLKKLTGAEFDRTFLQMVIANQKIDTAELEKRWKGSQDASVRAFGQQTLPTIKGHLTQAESLASKLRAAK